MRGVSVAIGAVILAAALALVMVRSQTRSSDAYDRATDTIRDLRESHARLMLLVTRARFELLRNNDPLVHIVDRLAAESRELEPGGEADYGAGEHEIDAARGAIRTVQGEQLELVEDFKSDNAVLKNAVAYLPIVAANLTAAARQDAACPEVASLASTLTIGVLSLDLSPRSDLEAALSSNIADLEAARGRCADPLRPLIASLLAQARAAIAQRSSVDEAVSRLAALPVNARYDAIVLAQRRHREAELVRADAYRWALGSISGLLLAAILLAIVRLIRGANLLASANARLAEASETLRATLAQLLDAEQLAVAGRTALDLAPEIGRRLAFAREVAADARAQLASDPDRGTQAARRAALAECEQSIADLESLVASRFGPDAAAAPVETRCDAVEVLRRCVAQGAADDAKGPAREFVDELPKVASAAIDGRELQEVFTHILAFVHSVPREQSSGAIALRANSVGESLDVSITVPTLALGESERLAILAPDAARPGESPSRERARRLGIAIAERIVARNGGELRISTEPSGGTSFHIQLVPVTPV